MRREGRREEKKEERREGAEKEREEKTRKEAESFLPRTTTGGGFATACDVTALAGEGG